MNKKKILLTAIMLVIAFICIQTNKVEAALQANGGAPAVKNVNGWITGIRQMQTAGQALGLTDTINGTNLTSTNKNLDIHMQKNTEYGALVLLSASAYGNPNKITDGQTTTGNKTGVVMKLNKEWVAAGTSNTAATSMKNASARYKNVYPTPTHTFMPGKDHDNYVAKVGDTISETVGWHGSGASTWLHTEINHESTIDRACLIRAYSGSIFSYYGYAYTGNHNADNASNRADAHYNKTWASRAVVVVGSGV